MGLDEINSRKEPTGVITFRVPLHMKADAVKFAADQGKNMNQWAAHVFAQVLSDAGALSFDWDKQRTILIDNLKADKERLSKEAYSLQEKINDLQADLKAHKAKARQIESKASKTASNESKLSNEVKALKSDLKAANVKIKGLEGNSSKASADLQKQLKLNSQAAERIKADGNKINDLQKQVKSLSANVASLTDRVDKANAKFKEKEIGVGLFGGKVFQV